MTGSDRARRSGREDVVTTPDGRALHLWRSGPTDAPAEQSAVVFEAGLGASGATWGPVQEITSRTMHSVSYDRAGYGASTPAHDQRGIVDLADDLERVVEHLAPAGVVLVGHSWGGSVVRELAGRSALRDRVAGLVLVDPSDEGASLYFSRTFAISYAVQRALLPMLARTPLLRRSNRSLLAGLPEPWLDTAVTALSTSAAARAVAAEGRQLVPGLRHLQTRPPDVGQLPVRVLSGQLARGLETRIRTSLVAAHRARAAASPHGRFVPARASGHMILLTEPELVAQHVLEIARS